MFTLKNNRGMSKNLFVMNPKKELLIRALDGKGEVLNLLGRYDEAIDSFQKVLKYSKNSHLTLAKSKRKIADVYQNQDKYETALKTISDSQRFLFGDSVEEQLERVEIYLLRCWIYRIRGEMERAIKEGEMGLRMVDEISPAAIPEQIEIEHKRIKANGFNSLGAIFWTKGEYDKALELYQKYLRISEELGDRQGIGKASNNLGTVYSDKGEYDKAIELFRKYLRISEEIGDKRGIGIASFHLGGLFLELGELKKAEEHLLVAKKVLTEIGDKFFLIDAFTEIAELKIKQNFIIEALKYADNAFKLAQELGSKHDKARALLMQARIFYQGLLRGIKGDRGLSGVGADTRWHIADMKFKEAIKIFEELKQPFEIAKAYYYYGEMLKSETLKQVQGDSGRKGGKKKANEYLQKAREIFEKIGAKGWLKRVNELLERI